MLRAVLFDIDDTLYEFLPVHESALAESYKVYAKIDAISFEEFCGLFKKSWAENKEQLKNTAAGSNRILIFQKLIEKKLDRFESNLILELYETYWNNFFKKIEVYPGVIDTFRYLKRKGVKIGIITDLTAMIQMKKIEKLSISGYVDAFSSSEECGTNKPNEKIFISIMKKLGIKNDEVLMVGDNESNDIVGAKNLGIKTIHLLSGGYTNKTEGANRSDYYANSFNEVKEIIMKLV